MNSISPNVNLPEDTESTSDAQAKMALFSRYAPALFAFLRQHTASREDAEDLLHEIFVAALKWEPFDGLSVTGQEKWLWRVARNYANGHLYKSSSQYMDYIMPYPGQKAPTPGVYGVTATPVISTTPSLPISSSFTITYSQPAAGKVELYWGGQLALSLSFTVKSGA